jgi:K+-transporting ATPase A subunit
MDDRPAALRKEMMTASVPDGRAANQPLRATTLRPPIGALLLVGVVLIMGGLAYFPAVSLGPVTEQVAMYRGVLYPAP